MVSKSPKNLVTVCGHNPNMLYHMIEHYQDIVDDVFVNVYDNGKNKNLVGEVEDVLSHYGLKIYNISKHPPYDWNHVTHLYNETKRTKPNDWWVISDDDEFHEYPKPLEEIIYDCEENGWEFVSGGFLDRLGVDGTFPKITKDSDVWEQFPLGGFFREPISNACPNKIVLSKGHIDVTPGQHYAIIDGQDTYGDRWNHPKKYPIDECFVIVNHMKWDFDCFERLRQVTMIKQDYSYYFEYKKMYEYLLDNNFRINIKDFMIEDLSDNNWYSYWEDIKQKCIDYRHE